ncbi:MAG: helix-turn-helix domain-containing protein [Halobacteriales archaeon]|nr:helix-turn-helix domain-containing protein [Halobacteriales archaeon]
MTHNREPSEYRPAELLGYKWTVPVVTTLADEPHRFNELRRAVGDASAKVLSDRLKQLEEIGIVSRTVLETNPPSVCYELTDRGRDLHRIIVELEQL